MKSSHPVVKILTGTLFIVLMLGFIAFRSGAFDRKSATIKLHVALSGRSHHQKVKSSEQEKKTFIEKPHPTQFEDIPDYITSSKSIVTTPVIWSKFGSEFALMAGSKSAGVMSAPASSVYGGIFTTPYWWKAKSKGEYLKQGRK